MNQPFPFILKFLLSLIDCDGSFAALCCFGDWSLVIGDWSLGSDQ